MEDTNFTVSATDLNFQSECILKQENNPGGCFCHQIVETQSVSLRVRAHECLCLLEN